MKKIYRILEKICFCFLIILFAVNVFEFPVKAEEAVLTETVKVVSFETAAGLEIRISEKKTLNEVQQELPESLEAVAENGVHIKIPVTWQCVGDYEKTNYYYYEFIPVIDEAVYEIPESLELPYVWVIIESQEKNPKAVTNSKNETEIYEFLVEELNCNMAAAVGILANIERESGFNPKAKVVSGESILYYGICQWGNSRFEDLKRYCKEKGYDHDSLKGQLNFLKYELYGSESNAWKKMQGIEDTAQGAYTAGYQWAKYFERCASVYYEVSAKRARDVYWPEYLEATKSSVYRISGTDRYATGIRIADRLKEVLNVNKLNSVVLVDGRGYADALSGSYLAYVKNAAILLVNDKNADKIQEYVSKNMKASGTVYILGGENAVSLSVEQKFSNYKVKRLFGATRYETNLAVLKEMKLDSGELLVCTGTGFADSLSASASGQPILLVGKSLTEKQKQYLTENSVQKFYLIGGNGAVSQKIEEELSDCGTCIRVSGTTRYATSVNTAKTFCTNAESVILTYGKNYPDGICGGVLAAKSKAALLLVSEGNETEAKKYVSDQGISEGFVLGGQGLVTNPSVRKVFGLNSIQRVMEY